MQPGMFRFCNAFRYLLNLSSSVEDEGPSWREAFPIRRNNPLESRYMLTPGPLMTAALT